MQSDEPQAAVQGSSTSSLQLNCPHCSQELELPSSAAGSTATCSHCGGRFQVPLPTARVGGPDADYQEFVSKKMAAGVCGILLGGFGVHKFILGFTTPGIIMLAVWLAGAGLGTCLFVPVVASLAMSVIGVVEGIIYLTKSDDDFYQTYAVQKKEWF
jgi:TM2 domain-containing membrane protein YozV